MKRYKNGKKTDGLSNETSQMSLTWLYLTTENLIFWEIQKKQFEF
jgi:hypothetical protein